MPKIVINLYNTKNDLKSLKTYINEYKTDVNDMYVNLNKVDSAWNDDNSVIFLNKIRNDRNTIIEHFSSVSRYITSVEEFVESLENTIYREVGIRNVKSVRFDSTLVDSVISSIDRLIDYMEECNNIITYMAIPNDYGYKDALVRMENQFIAPENSFINLKNTLNRISRAISNTYYNTRDIINRIDFIEIDGKRIEYNYRLFNSLEGKQVRYERVNKYSQKDSNKIDNNVNQNGLNIRNNSNNLNENKFDINIRGDKLTADSRLASQTTKITNDLDDVVLDGVSQNRNVSGANVIPEINNEDINSTNKYSSMVNHIQTGIKDDEISSSLNTGTISEKINNELVTDSIDARNYNNYADTKINHSIEEDGLYSIKRNTNGNYSKLNAEVIDDDEISSNLVNNNSVNKIGDSIISNESLENEKTDFIYDNSIGHVINSSSIESEKLDTSSLYNNKIDVNIIHDNNEAKKIDNPVNGTSIGTSIKSSSVDAKKNDYTDILNRINNQVD